MTLCAILAVNLCEYIVLKSPSFAEYNVSHSVELIFIDGLPIFVRKQSAAIGSISTRIHISEAEGYAAKLPTKIVSVPTRLICGRYREVCLLWLSVALLNTLCNV